MMRIHVRLVVAGLALAVASAGPPSASAAFAPDLPRVCEGQPREGAEGSGVALLSAPDPHSARFGLDLLGAIAEEGPGNALVSPLGIGTVLAMVSQGATESVRQAIGEVVRGDAGDAAPTGAVDEADSTAAGESASSPDTEPALMLACQLSALRNAQVVDGGVEVRFANGAFANRNLELFPAFSAALDAWFEARVERMDFADEGAVARVNGWVSEVTDGAIPRLISTLDPDDALVLANAVRFRGDWTHPFDPERTVPAPFRLRSGASVEVPTMHAQELSARYREDDGFQAVAIPYGTGGFEMVAVVPRGEVEAREAIRRLESDPTWLGRRGFERARGSLALPRLTLEAEASLLPALRSLGLESALNDAQAFAGITTPPPMLSQVLHRTMLVLDEKGTEAAAATAAVMTTRAAIEPVPFDMRVDRPFALAVRYRPTGTVLFAAWVENPAQE